MSTQPTSKDLLAAIRAKAIVGSKKWECCDVRGSLHEIVDMIDAATSSSVEPRNDDDGRARPTQQDESGRLSQDQRAPDQLNAATGQKSGSSSPTPPPGDVRALLQSCVDSLAGYRREMNDHQPCDAEQAARAFLK